MPVNYGMAMSNGPQLLLDGRQRKVYLVSLMDDASRLITHSAFVCPRRRWTSRVC